MAWTERQRQMLQEMGIRLWAPVAPAERRRDAAARSEREVRPGRDPRRAPPPLPRCRHPQRPWSRQTSARDRSP